ncbi:phosphonate C-P lyase system protein PhnH [Rhizobium altiplani]|uniref:Phosphonate C-P lyase system protein PhnH n=1 Tax=Rhizobium altiplani TaxID=1864509 RepID=A0A125Q4F6_9HYPH|nr:phosphonate C-P lyase system protein PhnH [Rhizobium altiplani]KWV41462.1 phosphonate C-P lyase system protein PhnH [Rhizobium altiplani]
MSLKTEVPKNDVLAGGFAEPVFHAQSVFKLMMDAMARPGTIQTVAPDALPPAPLGVASGAIALTLCDHDTPVWLSSGLAKSAVPQWLGFHTGAPVTSEKAEARFAFVEAGTPLSSFGLFAAGTQEYPDRSTTVVIELADIEGGRKLALMGPGIKMVTDIAPLGLPDTFLRLWTENRALFPRGIDIVLTSGSRFVCLPRTTKITATEM